MIKDIVNAIDYSDCAGAALVLFVFTFALLVLGTLRLSHQAAKRFAAIPLSDEVEEPCHGE